MEIISLHLSQKYWKNADMNCSTDVIKVENSVLVTFYMIGSIGFFLWERPPYITFTHRFLFIRLKADHVPIPLAKSFSSFRFPNSIIKTWYYKLLSIRKKIFIYLIFNLTFHKIFDNDCLGDYYIENETFAKHDFKHSISIST